MKAIKRHVRLYRTLRSAHLERAREWAPATIMYQSLRYDFDDALTEGLDLERVSTLRAALRLATSSVEILEVNEPLMLASLPRTAVVLGALRLTAPFRRRPLVVTYAIENLDPLAELSRLRAGLGSTDRPRHLVRAARGARDRLLVQLLWRRIDRIAYGTDAAQDLYRRVLPARSTLESVTVAAVPCAAGPASSSVDGQSRDVVFLGALSRRKGFDLLMRSWPFVLARRPSTSMLVLGTGALEQQARDWADSDGNVQLVLDPARHRIAGLLAESAVLVLPSQPTHGWREQVGLPIVEALAQGCSVVTTTETGLAEWLRDHGHTLIPPGERPAELADAIVQSLESARSRASVLADLPARDGRGTADAWLFRPRDAADAAGPYGSGDDDA